MSLKHISGWVEVSDAPGPVDPGYGVTPPLFGGWSPADPGYGRPAWGGRPDNSLPGRPAHPGNKPPGRPVVPPHPSNKPPSAPAHPWVPGHWEPIDPGFGKPPIFAFFPVDPGWDVGVVPPPTGPGSPSRPDNSLPGGHPGGGQWVPTDPDYGKPIHPCPPAGGIPHPPIWAWVPDLPDFGGGKPIPEPTDTTLYPSTVTSLASGGSGSVNVTSDGIWIVDPASVPSWITVNPMSAESDTNLVYTVTANSTGLPKQAFIKVDDAVLTINQGAV